MPSAKQLLILVATICDKISLHAMHLQLASTIGGGPCVRLANKLCRRLLRRRRRAQFFAINFLNSNLLANIIMAGWYFGVNIFSNTIQGGVVDNGRQWSSRVVDEDGLLTSFNPQGTNGTIINGNQ